METADSIRRQSIVRSSQAAASRVRLDPTPSIHTESALWIKKAPGSSRGSAFLTPPPVSRRPARSSENSMAGVVRSRTCSSIRSALWWTLMTARVMPATARRSSTWSRSGLPCTGTSGLGRPLSAGAMRVPSPAHRTIAVFSEPAIPQIPRPSSLRQLVVAQLRREMAIVPCCQCCEGGRPQVPLEISPGARDVLQVVWLAVALEQTQPQPQEAGVSLSAEVGIGRGEGGAVEGPLADRDLGAIVVEELAFELGGYAGAGVLEEGDEIEGKMLRERILEVEDADPGHPLALGQPHEVGRMIVPQEPPCGESQ